jgi:predicted ATPase/tetratricopeptide (TPR) repeat protein
MAPAVAGLGIGGADEMTYHGRASALAAAGSFVGRERELRELRHAAGTTRALTLTGPGGVGKTRLLRALAAGLAPRYPDGTFVVRLSDLHEPELVASCVASAVGVSEEPGIDLAKTLAEALRDRRLLLALDGCERVAGSCASLSGQLLAVAPGLAVLAASRVALGIAGETAWPVPPMAVPEPEAAEAGLEQAACYDAFALFADRAGVAAPGLDLSRGSRAAIAGIGRATGGLPQAIELAAARADVLAPGQIAASLGRLRDGADPAGADGVLGAVIRWSHDLLAPAEQVLLRRLSVFAGWSLEMAERVCADAALPAARILGLLARLADASLIEAEPDGRGERRYRMPGSIRRHAAEQLGKAGEAAIIRRRLRDCVLSDVEYPARIGAIEVPASWAVLRDVFERHDAGNVRVVLGWCLEQGDIEAGLRICAAAVWPVRWARVGTLAEWAGWLDAFLAADQAGVPGPVRGAALTCRAQIALASGDNERAQAWAAEGLPLCGPAAGWRFPAMGHSVLVEVALASGRTDEALKRADEALARAGQPGEGVPRSYALSSRAIALAAAGRLAEAQEATEAVLALMTEIGHQYGAAVTRLGLGDLSRLRGDLSAARDHYQAALPTLREAAASPEAARCLTRLGRVAADQGDLGAAREYLAEGLRLSQASGSREGIARALAAFAALAIREGSPGRAVRLAGAVTALRAAAHLPARPAAWAQRYRDAAAGLGAAEASRLWASGLELTSGAAAHLALEPCGIL